MEEHIVTDEELTQIGKAFSALIEGKAKVEESDWTILSALMTKITTQPEAA